MIARSRLPVLPLLLWGTLALAQEKDPLSAGALLETVKTLADVRAPGEADAKEAPAWAVKGGRGPRSGGWDVARWVASRMEKAGLRPAGDRKDLLEPFDVELRSLRDECVLAYCPPDAEPEAAALPGDYLPLCFSAEGDVRARVAFVGYGITSAERNYDDYAGLDVRGLIALAFSHEPHEDREAHTFDGRKLSREGTEEEKALNAQRHGAAALVIIPDEAHPDTDPLVSEATSWPRWLSQKDRERIESDEGKNRHLDEWTLIAGRQARYARVRSELKIPCVVARRSWVQNEVLRGELFLPDTQKQIDASGKPRSVRLAARLSVAVAWGVERLRSANVVGELPGQTDEAIVVGAHYDHFDPVGKTVWPGACDNASGVAVLLGVAQAMAAERPRRAIVFAAFGGEELGLQGSRAFVADPPVPLPHVVAMVNLDMAGRGEEGELTLIGVLRNPELADVARQANQSVGFALKENIEFAWPQGSDHFPFHEAGLPALMLTSSRFPEYHTSKDTADLVSGTKMAKVGALLKALVERLAAGDARFPAPREVDVPYPSHK